MYFVWCGKRDEINALAVFYIKLDTPCERAVICAADYYRVFADGELLSYGPERCAAGYARTRDLDISGVRELRVEVLSYGTANYCVDRQDPYFAIELSSGGKVIYDSRDFKAYRPEHRIVNMPRYSPQRGYAEGYDMTRCEKSPLELYPVPSPVVLEGSRDVCDYGKYSFKEVGAGSFEGFDGINTPTWLANGTYSISDKEFSIEETLERCKNSGYTYEEYELYAEKCGFLSFDITSEGEGELVAAFEEIKPEGKWIFRRAKCNDFVYAKVPKGESAVLTVEPYAVKLLRIIHSAGVKVTPRLIAVENCRADKVSLGGDERIVRTFEAARNTFMQNAVDIFMDCPGRERAGWLCDAFFTAKAELLFTGKNTIERAYLENFLLAKTPELPEGMLPMCFPSEQSNGRYIPNWAMWFVIELWDYLERTGDRALVDAAKDKVYGIVKFFDKYLNSDGLLENLESWVFIEWSICNDDEYVKGVNYPSNMLYAFMLDKVAELYGDSPLAHRAKKIRKTIKKLAFNGKFYVDNATRVGGKLQNEENHLSETCQYYALFMGLECDEKYKKMMIEEFGPLRQDAYPEVGRSNMFIGNYLRFFWLNSIGEHERVLNECVEYFAKMANNTGTLWEHDRATASCNHGFASVAANVILASLIGYETTKDGAPVLKEGFKAPSGYEVKVEFNY
ncbi:MAG: hypothetical protein IJ459_04955 [Clostridia bacterium]|nr:hypothetical protein [Clostridia bacterium]